MSTTQNGSDDDGVQAAFELARGLLAVHLPARWAHSEGVLRQATALRDLLPEPDYGLICQAAILHDIGYSPTLARAGFHPLDGARHLRSLGWDEQVVGLVAHHSCADVEAAKRGLEAELGAFAPGPPHLMDALVYCDMTTSPDGSTVTITERLAEIRARYGEDSVVGEFIEEAEPRLRASTGRVEAHLGHSRDRMGASGRGS